MAFSHQVHETIPKMCSPMRVSFELFSFWKIHAAAIKRDFLYSLAKYVVSACIGAVWWFLI